MGRAGSVAAGPVPGPEPVPGPVPVADGAVGPDGTGGGACGPDVCRTRSASGVRGGGGATERARERATASWMVAASPAAPGRPWSVSIPASPVAYPCPTARTFQAPWRRYSSRALTAVSASRPVSVKVAISVPSSPVTAAKGAAVAPNLAGPPVPTGRASSTVTRCTVSGRASRSTARRWPAAACRETSRPGSRCAPGWATHSGPRTVPLPSARVAPATTGEPAEIRISRRVWGKVWFCPRTSSAVIALSPSTMCGAPGPERCSSRRRVPPGAARAGPGLFRSGPPTGAEGWTASGPGTCGRWPGFRGRSSAIRRPRGGPWP
ncbi:hypothetical protein GA0115244_100770 [Streptomyces sp. DvalAA-19]|nr:hypothetical protein GA0115244_100770 [Streptomyces sp. DvalAA-19]